MSVSIQEGWALPTPTPWCATSSRSALANCSTPALAAQYAAMPGSTVNAAAEETSRKYPRRGVTCGRVALTVRITPVRFTSMVRASASTGLIATVPLLAMPALATTTSIRPSRSMVSATARSRPAWSVTSHSDQTCSSPSELASIDSRSGSSPSSASSGRPGRPRAGRSRRRSPGPHR